MFASDCVFCDGSAGNKLAFPPPFADAVTSFATVPPVSGGAGAAAGIPASPEIASSVARTAALEAETAALAEIFVKTGTLGVAGVIWSKRAATARIMERGSPSFPSLDEASAVPEHLNAKSLIFSKTILIV